MIMANIRAFSRVNCAPLVRDRRRALHAASPNWELSSNSISNRFATGINLNFAQQDPHILDLETSALYTRSFP